LLNLKHFGGKPSDPHIGNGHSPFPDLTPSIALLHPRTFLFPPVLGSLDETLSITYFHRLDLKILAAEFEKKAKEANWEKPE